ncbi:hypothetical protein JTB14_019629 [Gonioctena quinquepunctata]|nr:hypothetical protein JTB14_019629 [Gonioctena quinquepunctata]
MNLILTLVAIALTSASPIQKSDDSLLSVVQIFRHGQRGPIAHYTNDPYTDSSYWPVSSGQLTNGGKHQHLALGQFTRQRYDGWLPENYTNTYFYAQTTDIDRTHMSVQSNLLGLYPPKNDDIWNENVLWQPIPVHPSDENITSTTSYCTALTNELSRVLNYDPFYVNLNAENRELYSYLTNSTGDNITAVSDVWLVYDTLMIEEEFGYTLPNWTQSVYPEPLKTLTGYVFKSYAFNKKLARLSAGTFLNAVVEHFESILSNSTTKKYQMYSAHDTNLAIILQAIGAFKNVPPYFANSIYFELRESGSTPYINIYYKNKEEIEQITVEGCQFDCILADFKAVLSDIIVDITTWTKECSLPELDEKAQKLVEQLFKHQLPGGPGHFLNA